MKKLFIFASYDKDQIIDDYVIYYIKKLSEIGDVVFVADNYYSVNELNKIVDFTIKIIATKHEKYDFGSYSIGYKYAMEKNILLNYDYIIFCNDSVYGPFYSLTNIFNEMLEIGADFWGFSKNTIYKHDHLQSYFLCISKNIFLNKYFKDFMFDIKKLSDKSEVVVKYEVGLSQLIVRLGFPLVSFYDWDRKFKYDPQKEHYLEMIKSGFPFLKRQLFSGNMHEVQGLHKYHLIKKIIPDYPFEIIQRNLERVIEKNVLNRNIYKRNRLQNYRYRITILIKSKIRICLYGKSR